MFDQVLSPIRTRAGGAIFGLVAGPQGPATRRRLAAPDAERWFTPDRPICRVHADAAMFVGGLRALLLQSLHPLAMAAVATHSGFRGDPFGRLQRTGAFLAVTTFGTASDAEAMVARVRAIHQRVHGVTADGRPYHAADPHLLGWVHVAGADSFLRAYQRYGAGRLDAAERDAYVFDAARVAAALGVIDPPLTEAELAERLAGYRPELAGTPEARDVARFLLLQTPFPALLRGPYAVLAASAVGMLPRWARWPLRLPYLPVAEATAVRIAGNALVRGIRWASQPPTAGQDGSGGRRSSA